MAKKAKIGLSIIITAHHEGLISHKTVLSILSAVEPLESSKVTYEIIVSMDRPDQDTKNYYKRYEKDPRFRILEVDYGNVSDSRNNAAAISKGKYIMIIDGDDMISQNFCIDAYNMAEERDDLFALRPAIQLQFGVDEAQNAIWIMGDSFTPQKDAVIMVQFNRWVNVVFAPRKIFNDIKFVPATKGYGYEDYHFNTEMIARSIPQFIVPKTTFFYRRMTESKQNEHIDDCAVLPYTKLFDFDYCSKIDLKKLTLIQNTKISFGEKFSGAIKSVCCKGVSFCVRLIKKSGHIDNRFVSHIRNILTRRRSQRLPDWLVEQWRDINKIDNQLWPTPGAISRLNFHPLSYNQDDEMATRVGYVYCQLVRQFRKKPDYIFFTYDPLGMGGTEKVLAQYIVALKKIHPDWHFAIFRKKPEEFPFDLPSESVDFIDFFGVTEKLYPWERDIIFDRLIIQSQAQRLHFFFNGWSASDFSYNWTRRHRKLLRENDYKIYISWFMREFVPEQEKGRIMTFADPYLGEIIDVVSKVFTDNQNVINESLENNAYDPNKFSVHYAPSGTTMFVSPKKINSNTPLRILWAGRLSYQKRPDILRMIAEKLDPNEYIIDAYGREQHYNSKYLSGVPALNYLGLYKGFNSLPTEYHDVFLYTSQVDGVPNVLLEATARGLPIVASNDGGVCEFIHDKKTGLLVDIGDIDGYIKALESLKKDPKSAQRYVSSAQKLLQDQHSWEQFEKALAKDIK